MRIFLHCRCVESVKAKRWMITKMRGDSENSLPFFGDVLRESPGSALGATIFTAALADCGLVKKAMVGRGVRRGKAVERQTDTHTAHAQPNLIRSCPQHRNPQTSPPGTLIKLPLLLLSPQLHRTATLERKRSGQKRACLVLCLSFSIC